MHLNSHPITNTTDGNVEHRIACIPRMPGHIGGQLRHQQSSGLGNMPNAVHLGNKFNEASCQTH